MDIREMMKVISQHEEAELLANRFLEQGNMSFTEVVTLVYNDLMKKEDNKVTQEDIEKVCILYIRATSQNMIDYQVRVCEEYAEARGYEVIAEIIDRDGEQRKASLIEAEAGNYDILLAYNYSRIGRDFEDIAGFENQLNQCGVSLEVAVNE